jgi:class 3 adenylate cyclase/DNA-binding response OmpR family regulator
VKILVAEDDAKMSRTLQVLLAQFGYEVAPARDGLEAWAMLQADAAPQLVLLDWMMPGMDGLELCRKLRQRQQEPYCYVVLLTARAQRTDIVQGLEAGADDFIVKPFRPDELKARLQTGCRVLELQASLLAAQKRNLELYQHEHERTRRLQALVRIAIEDSILDPDLLMRRASALIREAFGYFKVNIGTVHEHEIHIERRHQSYAVPLRPAHGPSDVLPLEIDSVMAEAVKRKSMVHVPDVGRCPFYHPEPGSPTRSEVALPILSGGGPVAVIDAQSERLDAFREDDLLCLKLLAMQFGTAMENAFLYEKVERLVRSYVPAQVADHLMSHPDEMGLGGERRVVTVLFADLRRFSNYADSTEPEMLVEVLNQYLAIAANAILYHGGMVDKFMGDAVMALFNAPEERPTHVLHAVRAALQIQEKTRIFNQIHDKSGLEFGIGIHTGIAVVGNVGIPSALNYTAIGDAVNVAWRLQEHARGGEILISAEAYSALGAAVPAEPRGKLPLKGRSEGIEVFGIAPRPPAQPPA